MSKVFQLEGRYVGEGHPCFLIAEIGSNHCLDKNVVRRLIDIAADAGFDAVKFQIYDAEQVFSKKEMTTDVKLDYLYGVRPWWEVARDEILMPREWFGEMFEYARARQLIPLCAIHRVEDAKFLLQYGLSAFKIASIDLHFHALLKELAPFKKPLIISTGMAYLSEIDETVRLLSSLGHQELALLHCISQYPPEPTALNLNNIKMLQQTFNTQVGFSDHATGVTSSVVAVALGATIIEKHVTLDKNSRGPDHPFALEPHEMFELVRAVRETEASLGSYARILSEKDLSARKMVRRSIVTVAPLRRGEKITLDKIKFARPGGGVTTNEFQYVENRTVAHDIEAETVLQWSMIES